MSMKKYIEAAKAKRDLHYQRSLEQRLKKEYSKNPDQKLKNKLFSIQNKGNDDELDDWIEGAFNVEKHTHESRTKGQLSGRNTGYSESQKSNSNIPKKVKIERKFDYAVLKIQKGDYASACAELRGLLENYVIKLCEEYDVSFVVFAQKNISLNDRIQELNILNVISTTAYNDFIKWKRWGNIGAHNDKNKKISKNNAKQFLNGIAAILDYQNYVDQIMSIFNCPSRALSSVFR